MIRRHRPRQARLSLRLRLASGLLAFAALALPGLAPEAIAQTLRWAAQNDILTLDPHAQNHGTTNAVIQHTYEGLTRYSRDYKVEPALAASWQQTSPTEWRF